MPCGSWFFQHDPALQVMAVIMVMAVNRQLLGPTVAKHGDKFWVHRHHFWRAGATDVLV
jgi:hypothetical protein